VLKCFDLRTCLSPILKVSGLKDVLKCFDLRTCLGPLAVKRGPTHDLLSESGGSLKKLLRVPVSLKPVNDVGHEMSYMLNWRGGHG